MTAPQAAGVIHSDFEKGFIRAETVSINDMFLNSYLQYINYKYMTLYSMYCNRLKQTKVEVILMFNIL
jgi:ribosome-binding ATPase YchF (GTP1/OBG family)